MGMDFAQQQRNPAQHLVGIAFVILMHVGVVYALVTGLAHKVVEVVRGPLETKFIADLKKPLPDTLPPPKLAPPPPFIPPPEIKISVAAPVTNTITQFTSKPVSAAAPAPAPPQVVQVRTAPVIDAKRSCAELEYPSASRRLEESGTVVLRFLIDESGKVIESKAESSSGFDRLDKAAQDALGRCQFKPGTVDGKPVKSWASLKYTWKLQ